MAKLHTYVASLIATLSPVTDNSSGDASVGIVSGAMEVYSGTGAGGGNGLARVDAASSVDVDETSGYFEIVALPTGGRIDIPCNDASEDGYRLRLDTTTWLLSRLNAGTPTTLAGPTTWSSTTHRWFRYREVSGTFYMEFAPDNGFGSPGAWVTAYSEATNTNANFTHTAVDFLWNYNPGAGVGTARFRYLNTAAVINDALIVIRRAE